MSKHNKWFRIATAGQTTDGREIQTEWIEQMAATYDPSVYGARINVEHMRGFMPDGDFGAKLVFAVLATAKRLVADVDI